MPAMKPSTTSRARTSRCARRATTSGSRKARPSALPRATPRSGCAPEPARGKEALTSAPPRAGAARTCRAPGPRSCRLPPGPGDDLLVVALERRAVEAALDLPARKSREGEQQLQLVAVDPALAGLGMVRGDETSARIQLAHFDLGVLALVHDVLEAPVVDLEPIPGLRVRGLVLEDRLAIGTEPQRCAGVRDVEHERAAGLEVLAAAAQRGELVLHRLAVREHVE